MLRESPSRLQTSILALLSFSPVILAEELPRSPASDTPRPGVVRTPPPPSDINGLPLALVFFNLRGTSGITGGDTVARAKIGKAFGVQAGMPFNGQAAGAGLQRVRALDFVKSAAYALYESDRAGHVVLALTVEPGPKDGAAGANGMLTGQWGDFPVLYQDERTFVRFLLDGGLGSYNEFNPWFGNAAAFTGRRPIALDPAEGDSASRGELSMEYALSAITQPK